MVVPNVDIRPAAGSDADSVGQLVFELLEELASPESSGYELEAVTHTARDLLEGRDPVWAFVAEAAGQLVGVITLNECASIYASGRFGDISEFYVRPRFRGLAVGKRLLDAAVQFARQHGWSRLEVGAPEVPKWQRSVTFYRHAGFSEVGPLLKLELQYRVGG